MDQHRGGHLSLVEDCRDLGTPSPPVPESLKHELLGTVIAALDEVIPQWGDLDEWKWACVGVRRHMAESIGLAPTADADAAAASPSAAPLG